MMMINLSLALPPLLLLPLQVTNIVFIASSDVKTAL
jgi:hypothetical protein